MVRIIRHSTERIPDAGSFEVRFEDGRESTYFYWDDNAGRRSLSMSVKMSQEEAKVKAQELARAERDKPKA